MSLHRLQPEEIGLGKTKPEFFETLRAVNQDPQFFDRKIAQVNEDHPLYGAYIPIILGILVTVCGLGFGAMVLFHYNQMAIGISIGVGGIVIGSILFAWGCIKKRSISKKREELDVNINIERSNYIATASFFEHLAFPWSTPGKLLLGGRYLDPEPHIQQLGPEMYEKLEDQQYTMHYDGKTNEAYVFIKRKETSTVTVSGEHSWLHCARPMPDNSIEMKDLLDYLREQGYTQVFL